MHSQPNSWSKTATAVNALPSASVPFAAVAVLPPAVNHNSDGGMILPALLRALLGRLVGVHLLDG